ncbi:MAG: cold shock domain-containing protein [Rickettsiaceae bacterium]|nr:cold shock domain-containing protein [Rickettsiaceae bacterium]
MNTGAIKWFDNTKGYGFIKSDEDGKDVFLHISALQKAAITNILPGQKVKYELEEKAGRVGAAKIELVA